MTVGSRPEVRVEIGSFHVERLLRPRRKLEPVPIQEIRAAREAEVSGWAAKVLAELPVTRVTQMVPVFDAINSVDVPMPLRSDVKDAIVKELLSR